MFIVYLGMIQTEVEYREYLYVNGRALIIKNYYIMCVL